MENQFMQRAIDLASLGLGHTSPNPLVGCVIVHQDKVVGEGYHREFGGAHAEVNAIQSVGNQSLLPSSTVYVTLEPCAHHGKTPPCAELLIDKKVQKVIVASPDPFPAVNGKGFDMLRKAGIHVELGLYQDQYQWINRRFFKAIRERRPYIILKWAQTADGFLAKSNGDSKWISCECSRQLVHKWRTEEDAVLVGKNTAIEDNPRLNVRDWIGRQPARILLDTHLKVPQNSLLYDHSLRTIVVNKLKEGKSPNLEYWKVQDLSTLLARLCTSGIHSMIIEGGTEVFNSFIKADLWDEARVFTSKTFFKKGIRTPILNGKLIREEKVDMDLLSIYVN